MRLRAYLGECVDSEQASPPVEVGDNDAPAFCDAGGAGYFTPDGPDERYNIGCLAPASSTRTAGLPRWPSSEEPSSPCHASYASTFGQRLPQGALHACWTGFAHASAGRQRCPGVPSVSDAREVGTLRQRAPTSATNVPLDSLSPYERGP